MKEPTKSTDCVLGGRGGRGGGPAPPGGGGYYNGGGGYGAAGGYPGPGLKNTLFVCFLLLFDYLSIWFCYLGEMYSVDGDVRAVLRARIRIGWNQLRQLVPLLINMDISLIMRGRLYSSCM